MNSTTETTYRAVIIHVGPNGEDFGRSMNAARSTLAEAEQDRIRINGGFQNLKATDDVIIEKVTVTTTVERV